MTKALTLYKKHSQDQLLAMQAAIHADPGSRSTDGGIHIYNHKARRQLSDIAEAITHHMADSRAAAGNPVPTNGYSGLKQNRRR
jgi:hypothetical protein